MKGLSLGQLLKLPIYLPPRGEQERIVQVLDTIEATVQQSEALIAKLKLVKTGLRHDLLTRGLAENGRLRDPVAQPDQFQDSHLGPVPRAWRIASLSDLVHRAGGTIQTGPFGSQLHAHEYVREGVPVVMPQDIDDGQIREDAIARITHERAELLARHRLRAGDVIFGRRGDLSRCAAVSLKQQGWLCGTGCLLVRLPPSAAVSNWLSLAYRQNASQRQIEAMAVGVTMANLSTGILGQLVLAVPPVAEQRQIVSVLHCSERLVTDQENYVAKLRLLKQGLMHDLLTGRVRVDALPEIIA